jgi:hypothetical protein
MALAATPTLGQNSPYRAVPYSGPKATFLRDPMLRLPIDEIPEKDRAAIREIKLFVKTPGMDWKFASSGPPTQTLYHYRAERDGEHAFFFVVVDRDGRSKPASLEGVTPHQLVVVDTRSPELGVTPVPLGAADSALKVEMRDANPDLSSVRLECGLESNGKTYWKPFPPMGPDAPALFRIPDQSWLQGKIRITGSDLAGNRTVKEIDFSDPTQVLNVAQQSNRNKDAGKTPHLTPGPLPVGFNTQAPPRQLDDQTAHGPLGPELKIPGSPPGMEDLKLPDVPAKIETSMKLPPQGEPIVPAAAPGVVNSDTKVDPFLPPSLNLNSAPVKPAVARKTEPVAPATTTQVAPAQTGGKHAILNAPRCSLEYAVETTPFAGPPRVEFWATRDEGRHWEKLVDETPGRSPAKLLLPGEGYFGIKARSNANNQQPAVGEAPDAYVEVDITKPVVTLLPATLGTGPELGTITLQWTAQDKNLVHDSIGLYYKTKNDTQWKPITSRIRNEGAFRWTVPQGIGAEVYLMVEARDRAGNVGRCELPDPINLPQPKVTVLGVGPVQ